MVMVVAPAMIMAIRIVSMAFIFFVGAINVIEGIIIQDQTGLSTLLIWLIGFPLIAFSLFSLILTIIG